MINKDVPANFLKTFGKPFDEKALSKLISKRLKAKQEEYYLNLIEHMTIEELTEMREGLSDQGKFVN